MKSIAQEEKAIEKKHMGEKDNEPMTSCGKLIRNFLNRDIFYSSIYFNVNQGTLGTPDDPYLTNMNLIAN